MASDRLIHYICTARAHCRTMEVGLTQHRGEWALCADLLSDGHEWRETGAVGVAQAVAQWQAAMGLVPSRPEAPAA